jgi:hypothetical protein
MLFSRIPDLVDLDLDLVAGLHPHRRRAPRAHAAGVPVTSTSPGWSVVQVETYSMIFGILKIICSVVACCMRSPFRRQESVILVFGRDLVGGDQPWAEAAGLRKFLPAVHWMVWRCQSRTEPSL